MPSTWLITIGADNVTDEAQYAHRNIAKGSLSVSQSLGGRRAGVMTVNSPDGTYGVEPGREVAISRKGVKLYGGFVWSQDPVIEAGTPMVRNGLTLVDFNAFADWRRAGERTWKDATAEQIVADIVAYDLDAEGITSTFVACATVIKGEYKIVGFPKVSEVLNDLAQRAEAQWYIDEHKNLRFFDADATGYAAPFEVTRDNVTELKISKTLEDYANKVKLNLRQYLMPEAVERFDSEHASYPPDGARRDYAVPYPIASAPIVTLNGTKVDLGQAGVEADAEKPWFWSPGSQFISQVNTGTPLAATDVLVVTYIGIGQLTVDATNDAEVAARAAIEGGSGFHVKVVSVEDQKSQQQADELAASILAAVDELPVTVNFRTNSELEPACDVLKPGDKLWVLGSQYIVRSIKLQDDPNSKDPDLLWLDAEAVRGPMLQDLSGILRDLASGGNTIPVGAPVDDSAAPPQTATEGDNMIPDGSFEVGGWDSNTEISARVSRVTGGSVHGTAHLEVTSGADTGGVYSAAFPVSEGLSIVFEGWSQRIGLVTDGLVIEARFYDSAEGELSGLLTKSILSGDDADWVSFSVVGTVPAGAVTARVFAYAGGHSTGVLKVDGLTLRRYSAIAAPPPMVSISASVAQDGYGVVTIIAAWEQPGDLGSTTAHQISAAWFGAEDAIDPVDVVPLNDPDYRLDVRDGEFIFGGPEADSWIEIWGANKNGDDKFSVFAKSARHLLTPGIALSDAPGDVQLDTAAPALIWTGELLTIVHRYAPNYPTITRFSPTLGAYISIEYGDAVTDSVDQPYTANAELDPPDNLQQFEVSIRKSQIIAVEPDEDGNRTIYLHACGYDDKGRVGYKPFPYQASSATRAISFTQHDLDGIEASVAPKAPGGATLNITVNNAVSLEKYAPTYSWTPAISLGGTDRYEIESAFGATAGFAPTEWINRTPIAGGATASYTGGPYPKIEIDQYIKFRIRAGNNEGEWTGWVVMTAPGALVLAKGIYSVPGTPIIDFAPSLEIFSGSRDGRMYGFICYWKEAADLSATDSYQLERKFWEDSPGTIVASEWAALGDAPKNIAVLGIASRRFGGDWPRQEKSYFAEFRIRGRNAAGTVFSPWAYSATNGALGYREGLVEVAPNPNPPSPTGLTLTIEVATLNGAPQYRFRGELAANVSLGTTKRYGWEHAVFDDAAASEGGVHQMTPWHEWDSGPTSALVKASPYYDKAPGTYYGRIRVVPYNEDDSPGTPRYSNIAAIAPTTGLNLGAADTASIGPGLYLDSGKVGNAARQSLMGGDMEKGAESVWGLLSAAFVDGVGVNGSRAVRLSPAGGFARVDQWVTVQPGEWYKAVWQARNQTSGSMQSWIAWADSAGAYLPSPNTSTNGPNITTTAYSGYQMLVQAPPGATRAQLVPGYSTAASGTGDVDAVGWEGMPKPAAGVGYDSSGNLVSTRDGINDPQFAFGGGDWKTVDGSGNLVVLDSRFAVVAGHGFGGTAAMRMQATGSGATQLHQRQTAAPGSNWRVRGMVKNETNGNFAVQCAFYDAAGAQIATGQPVTQVSAAPGVQQTTVNAQAAPSGTVKVGIKVYTLGNSGYAYVSMISLEPADAVGAALARVVTTGVVGVGDYSLTEQLIADAQITARTSANNLIGRTAQIDVGVIVAAHINSLTALDAFIRNLSVSQITGGGFLSLTSALDISTGFGHAASISQLGASFDGPVVGPSFFTFGGYGVGSLGKGFFTAIQVGGSDGVSGTGPGITVTNGIITGLTFMPPRFSGTVPAGHDITVSDGVVTGWI
jgi:hypothetical protein